MINLIKFSNTVEVSKMSKRTMSPIINTDETYDNYGLP